MQQYGKIVGGKLVIASKIIKNKNGGTITNPKEYDLIANGYKGLCYNPKPDYDKEEEKLIETYTEEENRIVINYEKVKLKDEEHNEIINNEISQKENLISVGLIATALINNVKGAKDNSAINEIEKILNEIEELKKEIK